MRAFLCLLLLFAAVLAGCQPVAPAVSSPTPVPTTASATSSPTPAPTLAPKLGLSVQPCKLYGGVLKGLCGTFTVPEDRSKPDGRLLVLRINVIQAKNTNPAPDPLVYLAGGPGSPPATEYVNNSIRIFAQIHKDRDIIFLDQRGTAGDHRLTCAPPPTSIKESSQAEVDDWIHQCLAGLDGDPRFYTTAEAMRDLDEARAALGYDKVNLYGFSYGVTAAQVYMRIFPEHVRSAVLDHGTALDILFEQYLPRESQAALEQLFTLCEKDSKCHAAYPDLRNEWQALLARVEQGPVATSYTPAGSSEPMMIDLVDVTFMVHLVLKTQNAAIPYVIHSLATSQDWSSLVESLFASQRPITDGSNDELLMPHTIFCFEPSWGFQPDEIARLNPNSYMVSAQTQMAQNEAKLCHALPRPDPSLIYGPGKPVPLDVLIFNSQLDPQNPPEVMAPVLKEFTRARQIVDPFSGHEPPAGSCRWDLMAQFVQIGSAERLDATCMDSEPSIDFVLYE